MDYFPQCKTPLAAFALVLGPGKPSGSVLPGSASTPKSNSPGTTLSHISTVKLSFSPRRVAKSKSPFGNSPRQAMGCPAEHLAAPAKTHAQPLAEAPAPILQLEHLRGTNELIWEGKAA